MIYRDACCHTMPTIDNPYMTVMQVLKTLARIYSRIGLCYSVTMPSKKQDLPINIGKPALNALTAAGITTLQQVAKLSDNELLTLHGVGPKAIRILRDHITKI